MTDKLFDAYIIGPIFGHADRNEPAFRAVASYVQKNLDLSSIIPHDIPPHQHGDHLCPEGYRHAENSDHAECCYARGDLVVMLRDCLGCFVLPGWPASVGSRLEVSVAAQVGMPLRFIEKMQLVEIQNMPNGRNHILRPPEGLSKLKAKKGGLLYG